MAGSVLTVVALGQCSIDKGESTWMDYTRRNQVNSRKCEMAVFIQCDISVSDHYHPSPTNRTV